MYNLNERMEVIKKVLCYYYNVDWEQLSNIIKKGENKYVVLLLLKKYNLIDLDNAKMMMGINSNRSVNNGIKKAEEKFLINKYFRDKYLLIEDEVDKSM